MIHIQKTKPTLIGFIVLAFIVLFSSVGYSQDVILNRQQDVDAFYPGSTYTGDIVIGRIGSGALSDITNLFNFSVLNELNGDLIISLNPALEDLDELSQLTTINGNLKIEDNGKLKSLEGFSNLIDVSQGIHIINNDDLVDLNGINEIANLNNLIRIQNNSSLKTISGFSKNIGPQTDVEISGNQELSILDGFQNVEEILDLEISSNFSLVSINGFSKLHTIGRNFWLSLNRELINIDALSQITSSKSLGITNNYSLEHLDALSNLIFVDGVVQITDNVKLTNCCGIQELLSDPLNISGNILIFGNPSECSTQNEIVNTYCQIEAKVFKNPPCKNESNGSIQVNVTNYDTIPFYYQWVRLEDGTTGTGTSFQNYFNIDMLSEGTYNLTISTPKPDSVLIENIELLPINGTFFEIIKVTTTNSSNELSNGSIEIIVSGSSPPYEIEWSGADVGSLSAYLSDTIIIPLLPHGEYFISIEDDNGNVQLITLTLLDETVPTFPCEEPLDIIILNDVSGSVDAIEYLESKDFFIDFLEAANIGLGSDESRASIIEWSNIDQQEIKIPMTGDMAALDAYKNVERSFEAGTIIHEAMIFGEEYFETIVRPDVERVIILATDGTQSQVPPSLVALADVLKAKGYHILTIAFDNAYNDIVAREVLFRMASIGALAPGAPAYSQLDDDLAENIVNIYLCPIDPGSSSNVYFNRDGSIDITELTPIANCNNPKFVDVTFTVEAFRELSIPAGTYVTFYLNDPEQFGATKLLSWQIPCSIPVDSSETYTVTLPMTGPSHIFAILNDDGSTGAPINFPITDIEELAYSNNIDDEWACIGVNPTLQALKYTTTPTPSCDTIVNYIINVCNISEMDAFGVTITDQPPLGFVLISNVVNLNACAFDNNGTFDILAGCCLSMSLTYDASGAALGYYGDQDVILDGPADQEYFGYEGSSSSAEDVILDGTIDCPSTLVEFIKEVSVTESCDDAFLTFTFTINNELNYPLYGLTFLDVVPLPSNWVFEPYNLSGLSIGTKSINQNIAQFVIDQVDASTVATFSFDLNLGFWEGEVPLLNSATLGNVPDAENGGIKTLTSNTTTSQIFGTPVINIPDTIALQSFNGTINLDALYSGSGNLIWMSEGDGTFIDSLSSITQYVLGNQDWALEQVSLNLTIETECDSIGQNILVLIEQCEISILEFEAGECDDNGTATDSSDDTFSLSFTITSLFPGLDSTYNVIIGNDTIKNYAYYIKQFISLPADDSEYIITFVDSQFDDCAVFDTVVVESCSDPCELELVQLLVTDCDDNGTPDDNTDDSFVINFIIGAEYPGIDSTYFVVLGNDTIHGLPYFDEQMITIIASNNIGSIQFVDSQNENCFLSLNVGIESCIYPCDLTFEQFIVSECNDGGTLDDESDDTYTVTFNLSGAYPGVDSTYFVIINNDTIGEYPYDVEQMISLPAEGIDYIIDFVDSDFSECLLSGLVNVGNCSNPCELNLVQIVELDCDDNGTPLDDTDDFFLINFNITASNPGLDSTYLVILENDTLGSFTYKTEEILSLPANGNELTIIFVDSQFSDCLLTKLVSAESCSHPCEMIQVTFDVSECDDNNTPIDNNDDTYTITFEIATLYPGLDSFYYLIIDNDTIGEFSYDTEEVITLPADGIEHLLTFVDAQHGECLRSQTAQVESCSNDCELTLVDLSISECDDNGTSDDGSDDSYALNFEISAANPGLDSTFLLIVGNNTIGEFLYDSIQAISLPTNEFDYVITFLDSQFDDCMLMKTVRLESCSNQCELSLNKFDVSYCNDNGTPRDPTDDTYMITINMTALYQGLDSVYFASVNKDAYGPFNFGSEYTLMLKADGEEDVFNFMDSQFEYCILSKTLTQEPCSTPTTIIEDIVIPNIFSPNNDGINDAWTVEFFNNSQFLLCDIYDRWGNLIYRGSAGEKPLWDGRFKDKIVNPGVYIFKIIYLDSNGDSILKYGDVTVIY